MDIDNIKWALQRTDEWTRNADSKSSAIVAIIAGMTAISFTNSSLIESVASTIISPSKYPIRSLILLVSVASLLASLSFIFASLSPRIKNPKPSFIYFGNLAEEEDGMSFLSKVSDGDYKFKIDLANQLVSNSKICKKKMSLTKKAGAFTAIFIISFLVFVFLSTR